MLAPEAREIKPFITVTANRTLASMHLRNTDNPG
jgi:hypothetical protein